MKTLSIGGFIPFTTIDCPGKTACVLFLRGCPWRCKYCSNPELLEYGTSPEDESSWERILNFLNKRKGILDAVVFSGGEATSQSDALIKAILQIKQLPCMPAIFDPQVPRGGVTKNPKDFSASRTCWVDGKAAQSYKIGLHTNGAFPDKLKTLLPHIDWIGLDIKTDENNYENLTGASGAYANTMKSLDLIIASGIDFEVRTTLDPRFITKESLNDLALILHAKGVKNFALQRCRIEGAITPFTSLIDESYIRSLFPTLTLRS